MCVEQRGFLPEDPMKKRYVAAFIVFTVISGLVFVGCGEDREDRKDIAGSWILYSVTAVVDGEEATAGPGVVSGTMFLGSNGSNWNLTITSPYLDEILMGSGQSWSVDGNILTLRSDSEPVSFPYFLDGDILTFTFMEDGDSVTYGWYRDSPSVLF